MNSKIILYLSVLIAFSNSLCINLPIPQSVYYGWFALIGFIGFMKGARINVTMMLFIIACTLSILFNDVPAIFQAEYRLIWFCLMILAIGPLNEGNVSNKFKWNLYNLINKVIVVGTVISFLGYLARVPLFNGWTGFNGFTNHTMTMSSIGGISSLICFKLFLDETHNLNTTFKRKWGFLGASVASILVCFLGASRAALGATFVAVFFYLWFYLGNVGKFMKYLLGALFFMIVLFPVWYPYTEVVREKTEAREAMGGQFSSRDDLWSARVAEFESSPIWGIGFSSVDLEKTSVRANGGIEPGSSWFFMLSSVGLFGTLFFSILILRPIFKYMFNSNKYPPQVLLVMALLVWRGIHLFAEGYIMAAGDFSFLYVWILIALANALVNKNYKVM